MGQALAENDPPRSTRPQGQPPRDERWVLAYELGPERCRVPTGVRLPVGKSVLAGREGELTLGVEVPHKGISREAVRVTAQPEGWDIDVLNSNGVFVQPWGQPEIRVSGRALYRWPRIAVRVHNGEHPNRATSRHWVLLEADQFAVTDGPTQDTGDETDRPYAPAPLSSAQEEAVRLVFGGQLAWPPRWATEPLMIIQVAHRLGIGETAVRQRLTGALSRAEALGGLSRKVELTHPEYLYVLVRDGYLAPPDRLPYRVVQNRLESRLAAR